METVGEMIRLVTLTDGKRSKPVMVDASICSIASLLKEGKNKFRTKFQYIVYQGNNQDVRTDENLKICLRNHQGPLTFVLTNKEPIELNAIATFVLPETKRGISYMIACQDSIEQEAELQLKRASELGGCMFAIGMPDLHPGKGIPIGAVVMTEDSVAYPQLVDNDIGCGMSFIQTSLTKDKLNVNKLRKLANSLESIDGPYASHDVLLDLCSERMQWGGRQLDPLPVLTPSFHYENLGTIGGGNHFAELQQFDEVYDGETIRHYGIDASKIHLLVHSGSRSLGSQYLRDFCDGAAELLACNEDGHYGVPTDSSPFEEYLKNHDVALNFAARNRQLISRRLLEQITGETEPECKIDIYHNYMEKVALSSLDAMKKMTSQGQFPKTIPTAADGNVEEKSVTGWIHRKGATPTTQSKVLVIPGSRGTLSYLVEVNKDADHGSGYSLAHGAGRRMNRSKALAKHKSQYPNARQLLQTELGSIVICEKNALVYEEAPASYKDIDEIVECLSEQICDDQGRGLVRVLATLRPLLTYKYKDPYN